MKDIPRAPLRFHPVYKDYLWGGSRIAAKYGREGLPPRCAESWELSAHPNGMSIVSEGPLAGTSLEELCTRYGRALLGRKAGSTNRFPLLFKIIDARESLSVQVHPSLLDPAARPADLKNESWFLLDGEGTSELYAGFRDGVGKSTLERSLESGTPRIDTLLRRLPVHREELLFIPSGLVHAIGAGCLVYEVQQSSDVTYRFYDWDRVDSTGKARELHIAKAMRSIDWRLPAAKLQRPRPAPSSVPGLNVCVETPFFTIDQVVPERELSFDTRDESFHVLFVTDGAIRLTTDATESELAMGTSVLLPACTGAYRLTPLSEDSKALLTTL